MIPIKIIAAAAKNPIVVGQPCGGHSPSAFLSFPTWYSYLPAHYDTFGACSPQIGSLSDVWLIVAAVIEILLRIGALTAVGFVIYGGVRYIMSQGSPDETGKAKSTILNAVIGLVISISAAAIVGFIAGGF